MFGKQTEAAIVAAGRLAQAFDGGTTRLSASEIAEDCGLQGPFVAKTLGALAQAGLVLGTPGPGGGYTLARDPKDIRLAEVASVFHRESSRLEKPILGEAFVRVFPRALSRKLEKAQDAVAYLLEKTSLAGFRQSPPLGAVRTA
jgi:Rrf2 family protein